MLGRKLEIYFFTKILKSCRRITKHGDFDNIYLQVCIEVSMFKYFECEQKFLELKIFVYWFMFLFLVQ